MRSVLQASDEVTVQTAQAASPWHALAPGAGSGQPARLRRLPPPAGRAPVQRVLARLHEVGRQRQLLLDLLNHAAPAWRAPAGISAPDGRQVALGAGRRALLLARRGEGARKGRPRRGRGAASALRGSAARTGPAATRRTRRVVPLMQRRARPHHTAALERNCWMHAPRTRCAYAACMTQPRWKHASLGCAANDL